MDIDKYTTEAFTRLEEHIKHKLEEPTNFLLDKLISHNITFYGTTAIEFYLNTSPVFPFKIISDKPIDFFLNIFKEILNIFKTFFKIDKIKNTLLFKLNLQTVLIIHKVNEENFTPLHSTINNITIINPIYSIMDLYHMYSLPLSFINTWTYLINIDPKFIDTLSKPTLNYNSNKNNKNNKIYMKNFNVLKKLNILNNKNILLTGIYAYNEMMDTNYNNVVDIIVYNEEEIIEKLQNIYKNKLTIIKKDTNFVKYFNYYTELHFNDFHLITIYTMKDPFIYYHKTNRTNFHTTVFMLLFKAIEEKNETYKILAEKLLIRGNKEDLLDDGKFECFEVGFLDGMIQYLILNKDT